MSAPRVSFVCSYESLYAQLGLSKVVEYVQLGLLDPRRVITMKVGLGACTGLVVVYAACVTGKCHPALAVTAGCWWCCQAAGADGVIHIG